MKFIKKVLTMKIKPNNNITSAINKTLLTQILILGIICLVCLLYKEYTILSGFLISGLTLFSHLQLVKLSYKNKFLSLFGFPARLIIICGLCAILVHKIHPNLIALFIGFTIGLFAYIFIMWQYAQSEIRKGN